MTTKKTEKLLKRPDAFQIYFFETWDWLKKQKKSLMFTFVPVALILVGAASYQFYKRRMEVQRKHQLAVIEKAYLNEEKEFFKKKNKIFSEIETLEKIAKDQKVDNKTIVEMRRKELSEIKVDHAKSKADYLAFFNSNEKKVEGWRAGMFASKLLVQDKKLDEAASILGKILHHSIGIDFYQVQVRLMYIAILEDLKKFDESLAESDKLIALAPTDMHPRVYLNKARIQMEAGKKEDALKTLELLITKYSGTSESRQALVMKVLQFN